jgi:hypothetical protein
MTQTDRFRQFLRARAEREISETEVLIRIENDALVITNRCPITALQQAGPGYARLSGISLADSGGA